MFSPRRAHIVGELIQVRPQPSRITGHGKTAVDGDAHHFGHIGIDFRADFLSIERRQRCGVLARLGI